MNNIAAGSLARITVGNDSEINPFQEQNDITNKLIGINDGEVDFNKLCSDPDYLFKSIIEKGYVSTKKIQALYEKVQYVVQGKTDGGFSEVIAELEQIKQEIQNNKDLEKSNAKTL